MKQMTNYFQKCECSLLVRLVNNNTFLLMVNNNCAIVMQIETSVMLFLD